METQINLNTDTEIKEYISNINKKSKIATSEIKEQYLEDNLPWVIGFSGGKDSTAVLQLVFSAISELPRDKRNKEIHVLSNDTLVENPNVIEFLNKQLEKIEKFGKDELYNHNPDFFQSIKVVPKLENTFWLNLIGKGYPSPNKWFRWCTQRMKIRPTNEYIIKTVDKHGKAIILLGIRKSESSTRAISMRQYELENVRLRKHNSLRNAYIFAPIADWSTQEVWTYLIHNSNQWGEDVQNLLGLYRSASDVMECPLVIDDTTPSCGNSRFGCWTCTVIDQDKSMGYMIQNGEEWMEPLFDFRNWLKEIRDLPEKREKMKRNLQDGIGPFTIETRAEILERLLCIENKIKKDLITNAELSAIQLQWHYDGFFNHSVADIYYKQKGFKIMIDSDSKKEEEKEEQNLLYEICRKNDVNPDHIKELMEIEKGYLSHYKRIGVITSIKEKVKKFTIKESI